MSPRRTWDWAGSTMRSPSFAQTSPGSRTWAFDHARQLASDRYAAGAVLVQLSLSEGDVDAPWLAADRYGPGWAWRELADRGAEARPVEAADLYRPQLESDL